MSASCLAEWLVRVTDDQRCHVTLPRENKGMFWILLVCQRDSIGHRLVADFYRQMGRGDIGSLSLFLRSFSSGGVSVHEQAHHSLLGGGSLTHYKSFWDCERRIMDCSASSNSCTVSVEQSVFGLLQYSSQIVETEGICLELSPNFIHSLFTPLFSIKCTPLLPQC